jgi:hypothetical protein
MYACCIVLVLDPLDIPLGCRHIFLERTPVATLGETASASQVLSKGPIVRACWFTLGDEPWVCPYAKKWFRC